VPRICFINKMDKLGADFAMAFQSLRDRLAADPVAVQIPIGASDTFEGLIDLMEMKAVYFEPDRQGAKITVKDIPEEYSGHAQEWRYQLEETIAETCDTLLEKYIHGETLTTEELKAALRKATIANRLQPTFCGSALKFIGVQRLLDGVIDYLPSPADVPPVEGTDPADAEKKLTRTVESGQPFSGLVFKVVADKPMDLYFIRIYSGELKTSSRVLNTHSNQKENVSRVIQIFGKRREQLQVAQAGDIVAVMGLKNTLTGDTLCDPKHPVVLERIEFPETVISMAIEPKTLADRDKLGMALGMLSRQDPTFQTRVDSETGETLIAGMGELHLEVLVDRLRRDMNVEVTVGTPRVSYRETVTTRGEAEGKFVRQSGGRGQFAVVELAVEPIDLTETEGHLVIENKVRDGNISRQYISAVEKGVREACNAGAVAGYPVIDVKVTILDGKEHEVDSSELAFEHAGRLAFELAMKKAKPQLLEPIMKVEVGVPENFYGAVSSDLASRRAIITDMEVNGDRRVLKAQVPLANMFGYSTIVRSLTQGRASWSMEPSHYMPAPSDVAAAVIEV
jgi:elongation factor G